MGLKFLLFGKDIALYFRFEKNVFIGKVEIQWRMYLMKWVSQYLRTYVPAEVSNSNNFYQRDKSACNRDKHSWFKSASLTSVKPTLIRLGKRELGYGCLTASVIIEAEPYSFFLVEAILKITPKFAKPR